MMDYVVRRLTVETKLKLSGDDIKNVNVATVLMRSPVFAPTLARK